MTNPPTPDALGGKSPEWHRCMAALAEDEAMRGNAPLDHIAEDRAAMKLANEAIDFTETGLGRECVRGMLRAANEEGA